jgi:PAS domain S-box-containing protein
MDDMTPMVYTPLLLAVIAGLNLSIAIYVYRRDPRAGQNRAFAFMAATVGLWTAALALTHYGNLVPTWTLRLAFSSASLFLCGGLAFIQHLPASSNALPQSKRWLSLSAGVILCVLSFSPWIVVDVASTPSGTKTVYGPLHPVFAAYFLLYYAYWILALESKHRASIGIQKLQIRYFLLATAIPSSLAVITNLLVPLFLGTSTASKYGPFFSLFFVALIGHAIIRHRLMDIRVVIKRSAVYLAAFAVAGTILITLLIVSNVIWHEEHRTPIREIVLALAVAVVFNPLRVQIRRTFDRYLYREPYDYQRTIREASRALGDTIELPTLLSYISSLIERTLKSERVAIYLVEDDETEFELAIGQPDSEFPTQLFQSSALLTKIRQERELVFRDELIYRVASANNRLRGELQRLKVDVVVPLIEQEQVIGLLCLGEKRSGDPYFSNDADLLTTLANQSAVAIRNAQVHQRVIQMNEELQKILSTIESGVIASGAKGKISLFNRAAEQLTGMSAQEARGHPVEHLPAPLAELVGATAADGQSRSQVEFSLPDTAGQLVPLVCSTSPLLGAQGGIAGAVAVIADLSRLKELEQEKRQAERLASLEAIASGLVHEIRNPLVALKAFTQLLPIRFADADYREAFSRTADREIRRIEDLLTRFRTLSSISSQPMEPVDISGPLQDALETLRPVLEEHRIQLRRVADGTPRSILGNASELEQLFLNLCLNAIEAMEPEGELTARVADLSEGGGSTLLVEIADTGSGIPDELLPTIFNPFVTTKARGSGLGLAICRSITDAHHARLSARSNVGRRGSTFTIEFPVPVGKGARATT